ncbi:MAG TPA: hypothetical protein VFH06_03060 [Candidatus Saccharimonadales bacterium]|nr:hypothetical protein [Candidatus Saccharimonadales bacterium]
MQQYISTLYALEHFSDQSAFERLALDILNLSGNAIAIPMANRGGGDDGQDIVYTNPSNEKSCVFVSLEKKGLTKFKKDAAKHKKGEYREYSYFTTSYISYPSKKKITQIALDDLGAIIHIYDIETLRSLLDTIYTNLRSSYLGVDSVQQSNYEITSSHTRQYGAVILERSAQDLYEATRNKFAFKSSMANAIPVSLTAFGGIRSTEEILNGIKYYQQEVDEFNKNLSNLYSFTLIVQSDIYDENVEVQITSKDDIYFSFEEEKLDQPVAPELSQYKELFPNIAPVMPGLTNFTSAHRSRNEFFATLSEDGKVITSKIDIINPNQPKELFDERIFFKNPNNLQRIKLSYIVYSKHSKVHEQEYILDLKDTELIEFKPDFES